MLDVGSVISTCENCKRQNDISLNYFVGSDYRLKNSVIAICRSCNTDYIVTIDGPKIPYIYSIKSRLPR
jgi:hypothetical protein